MEIDTRNGELVRRIFAMYLGFDGQKKDSLQEIAVILTETGVKTSRGKSKWHHSAVRVIISNKTYTGEYTYKGHSVQIPELRIVPCEWFDAAQEQLKKNKQLA